MSEVKATTITLKMDGMLNEALEGLDKEELALKSCLVKDFNATSSDRLHGA